MKRELQPVVPPWSLRIHPSDRGGSIKIAKSLQLHYCFIQLDILFSSRSPGIINSHPVALNRGPRFGPAIKVKGLPYFIKQGSGVVWFKFKSITLATARIKLLHRIIQTTSCTYDRYGAVTH